MRLDMVFFCQFCCFSALSWKQVLRHTFEAHSNVPGFKFTCGVNGCPQTFQTYSAITSHLRRKHRGTDCDPCITLPFQDNACSTLSVADVTDMHPETSDDQGSTGVSAEHQMHLNKLDRSAALFLLSLKERYQITQTALDFSIGQVQQMVSFAVGDIQNAVETHLRSYCSESSLAVPDISDCFKIPDPFRNLQNEYMQTKFYREYFDLVVSCNGVL